MELVSNLEGKTSRFFYDKNILGVPSATPTSSVASVGLSALSFVESRSIGTPQKDAAAIPHPKK